ncbi:MAG: hypothetical protein LUD14_05865 [Clostridiales bacterium]|nr:hypothetical protein [Clostridiales bacterium]
MCVRCREGGDEFEGEALNHYKHDSLNIVKKIISLSLVLFGATLPLIIFSYDGYSGLLWWDWAVYALLFGGVFAVIAWIFSLMITVIAERKGFYRLSDEKQVLRSRRRQLKLKIVGITLLVIAGTAVIFTLVFPA